MKKTAIIVLMYALSLGIASTSEAFIFKLRHFSGQYHCSGWGESRGERYLWAAILFADGKGRYSLVDSIMMEDGSIPEPEIFSGNYNVSKEGSLSLHGYAEKIGILVQSGKGVMFGYISKAMLLTGQCWRVK